MKRSSPLRSEIYYYTYEFLPPEPDETAWGVVCIEEIGAIAGEPTLPEALDWCIDATLELFEYGTKHGLDVKCGRKEPHKNIPVGYAEAQLDVANRRVISIRHHIPGLDKPTGFD